MRTTFSGIAIALRALQAQQTSLDVTGHNVANANTPGFSRQRAVHKASQPYPMPMLAGGVSGGQYGTGVQVSQIMRMRDLFVETRLRQENPQLGYWETMEQGLSQVELFFNEPSETGIASALDQLWDSLQDLSHSAESESVRRVVVQRAQVLVEAVRSSREQLHQLRADLNNSVQVRVNEINILASQIADLNNQISKVTASGSSPNDLLDQRDVLLEQLSRIADIEVTDDHANMVIVTLDGVGLVQRSTAYLLETRRVQRPDLGYDKYEIYWQSTGSPATIKSGELGATLALRDDKVQYYIDALDNWTRDFAYAFNERHKQGYDLNGEAGQDFFVFSGRIDSVSFAAADIRINKAIMDNPDKIAASLEKPDEEPEPGKPYTAIANGDNAVRLAAPRHEFLKETDIRGGQPGDERPPLSEQFISIISGLGVDAEEAVKMAENRDVLVTHLLNLREATSGVSLDEEMANMIKFQHAYNAAARLMTAVDEALDVIINRLGVVGR